jgi:hypothetical protein
MAKRFAYRSGHEKVNKSLGGKYVTKNLKDESTIEDSNDSKMIPTPKYLHWQSSDWEYPYWLKTIPEQVDLTISLK